MKKTIFFLYGVVCYLIFFLTFLYAIGFTGNIVVPKSIDIGFQGGTGAAWLINILLLSLFAIQHSVMARQGFKKVWIKIVPKPIERSTYVLFSSIALILLFWLWRPITNTVWNTEDSILGSILTILFFIGWATVLFGTFMINHFELFGLQQVFFNLKKRDERTPKFVKRYLYKIVRHPLMLGFIIAFWAAPQMTVGHLLFAFATTGYILVAIQIEEQDMVKIHGDHYRRYQQEVSQIIPMPTKKVSVNTANKPV